jgi:hypothetical protein
MSSCTPRRRRLLRALAVVVALSGAGPRAGATILLFDELRDPATQLVVPTQTLGLGGSLADDYGDRVSGSPMAVPGGSFTYGEAGEGFTPAVDFDLFSSEATATDAGVRLQAMEGYGDLVNIVRTEGPGIAGAESLTLVLTATPGAEVDLYGFDLAGWNRTDYTIAALEVFGDGQPLFAASDVLVEGDLSGPGHTAVVFDPPLRAQELVVELDLSNIAVNSRDNIGIDSIRFGQFPRPAPEPGQALLLLVGGAMLRVLGPRGRRAPQSGSLRRRTR